LFHNIRRYFLSLYFLQRQLILTLSCCPDHKKYNVHRFSLQCTEQKQDDDDYDDYLCSDVHRKGLENEKRVKVQLTMKIVSNVIMICRESQLSSSLALPTADQRQINITAATTAVYISTARLTHTHTHQLNGPFPGLPR